MAFAFFLMPADASLAVAAELGAPGPAPAPPDGRSRLMEQASLPVPEPCAPDKTQVPRHRSVASVEDSPAAKADAGGNLLLPLFP